MATARAKSRLTGGSAVVSVLLVVLSVLPGPVWSRAFAFVATAFPIALMALGALRQGRLGRLGPVFLALLVLLEGAVAAILLLTGEPAGDGVFGLPPATVALLAGLWLLPLPLVAFAYAFTFDRSGITPEDLQELRTRFRLGSRH